MPRETFNPDLPDPNAVDPRTGELPPTKPETEEPTIVKKTPEEPDASA
jgi:hypothetical protein